MLSKEEETTTTTTTQASSANDNNNNNPIVEEQIAVPAVEEVEKQQCLSSADERHDNGAQADTNAITAEAIAVECDDDNHSSNDTEQQLAIATAEYFSNNTANTAANNTGATESKEEEDDENTRKNGDDDDTPHTATNKEEEDVLIIDTTSIQINDEEEERQQQQSEEEEELTEATGTARSTSSLTKPTTLTSPSKKSPLTGDALVKAIERENTKMPTSDNPKSFRNILPVQIYTDRDETKKILRNWDNFEWRPAYASGGKNGGPSSYTWQCLSHLACRKKIKMLYVHKLGGYIFKENGFEHAEDSSVGDGKNGSSGESSTIAIIARSLGVQAEHREQLHDLWRKGIRNADDAWNAHQQFLSASSSSSSSSGGDQETSRTKRNFPTKKQVKALFQHFQNAEDTDEFIHNVKNHKPPENAKDSDNAHPVISISPSNGTTKANAPVPILPAPKRVKLNETEQQFNMQQPSQNQTISTTTTTPTAAVAMHFPVVAASPMQLAQCRQWPSNNPPVIVTGNYAAAASSIVVPTSTTNATSPLGRGNQLNLADRIKRAELQVSGNSYRAPGNFMVRLGALEQDLGIPTKKTVDLKTRIAVIEHWIGIE